MIVAWQAPLAAGAMAWGVLQIGLVAAAWAAGIAVTFAAAMWLVSRRDARKAARTAEPAPAGIPIELAQRTLIREGMAAFIASLFVVILGREGDATFMAGILLGVCLHALAVLRLLRRAERDRGCWLLREPGGWRGLLDHRRFSIGPPSATAPPPAPPEKPA